MRCLHDEAGYVGIKIGVVVGFRIVWVLNGFSKTFVQVQILDFKLDTNNRKFLLRKSEELQ
jgi:hypothetical protein